MKLKYLKILEKKSKRKETITIRQYMLSRSNVRLQSAEELKLTR